MPTLQRIKRFFRRRPDITVWGDARSMPFTEGQAIVERGSIGPGIPAVENRR